MAGAGHSLNLGAPSVEGSPASPATEPAGSGDGNRYAGPHRETRMAASSGVLSAQQTLPGTDSSGWRSSLYGKDSQLAHKADPPAGSERTAQLFRKTRVIGKVMANSQIFAHQNRTKGLYDRALEMERVTSSGDQSGGAAREGRGTGGTWWSLDQHVEHGGASSTLTSSRALGTKGFERLREGDEKERQNHSSDILDRLSHQHVSVLKKMARSVEDTRRKAASPRRSKTLMGTFDVNLNAAPAEDPAPPSEHSSPLLVASKLDRMRRRVGMMMEGEDASFGDGDDYDDEDPFLEEEPRLDPTPCRTPHPHPGTCLTTLIREHV